MLAIDSVGVSKVTDVRHPTLDPRDEVFSAVGAPSDVEPSNPAEINPDRDVDF
jgi:hypothetical protein